MRRSVREAIVGFSIVGAIAGFAGTMLWLRGVRLGSETWTVTAEFANAGGLAARECCSDLEPRIHDAGHG